MPINLSILDFNEGRTNEWLIQAFTISVGSIACSIIIHAFFILLLIPGILLFLPRAGVQIDVQKKTIRRYNSLLNICVGTWLNFENLEQLNLKHSRTESTAYTRFGANRSLYVSFDVYFSYPNEEPFLFNDFLSYPQAKKICENLHQICPNIAYTNHIEKKINDPTRGL